MKLSPINLNSTKYKSHYSSKINNNTLNLLPLNVTFGISKQKQSKISSDILTITNSQEFKTEIKNLRDKSLKDRSSFNDFLISSIHAYNKHAINFPIKLGFFDNKIKTRFIEVTKKCMNNEIKNNLNDFLEVNYFWGFSNKKYGGPESFATAIPCILPYARGYEVNLGILKLKDLEKQEERLRNEIERQDKIIDAKEKLSTEYIQPVLATQKEKEIVLPNSIMLECPDADITNEVIQWLLSNTIARPIAIGNNNDDSNAAIKNKLKSALENARKTYEDYHVPTLIYCENFDKLLQTSNQTSEIAAIKALLTNTYKKYHATILFNTENSATIDNTLKQPHRMKQIKI